MPLAVPAFLALVFRPDQAKIRLVNQGCGLKRLAGPFLRKPRIGELAELLIDEREQVGRGPRVTRVDGRENTGHV